MRTNHERGCHRAETTRIGVLLCWCLLLLKLAACPSGALAQELQESVELNIRRRRLLVPNSGIGRGTLASAAPASASDLPPKPGPLRAAELPPAAAEPGEEVLPITLAAAMRLGNAQAWDIAIAVQQLRIAAAQLQGANVLWLPNLIGGVDYVHHDGPVQSTVTGGPLASSSYSSLYPGMAPLAVFALTDAIFTPLAQRQITAAQRANVQTATNDTLTSLVVSYFDAVEARADLASIDDVVRRMNDLVRKTISLAPELVPDLEVARVQAALASAEEVREIARRRWRVNSAEVARVLRLKPTVLIAPLEPPQLRVTLIPPERTPEELIPLAIEARPEMRFNQAQVEAARQRMRQERWRPFLPIFLARGSGNPYPYPLAFGAFGGGSGGTLSHFGLRSDFDLEAIWELRNLGFGNRAIIRQREEEHSQARIRELRMRDIVAKEVTQVWADLQSAYRRIGQAERELQQALISANKNLEGLGETKRAEGNIRVLVIRPLEVVMALQALNHAYYDYFGAIAAYNRAQFQLYRALGNPAGALAVDNKLCMPAGLIPGPSISAEEGPPPRPMKQP